MILLSYSFDVFKNDLNRLISAYSFLEVFSIGKSVLGNDLYCVRLGKGKKQVFYSGAYHANEWITSPILMKFIEDFCEAYKSNSTIYGYSASEIFESTSIYLVPMVNPDGVNLVTGFFSATSPLYQHFKGIANDYPLISFPTGWKANFNGVDLNLQFPALWENAKEIKYSQGFTKPSPRDFVGFGPLTEPEALAIYDFTLSHNFRLILAYHTQGEVIYWQFLDYLPESSYYIGEKFASSSGYLLETTPYESSFAGFKDWFIQTYNRPGYTIEAGLGVSPLPFSQFNKIYQDNLGILVLGAVLI